jgi:DNA mismatch repair protein MutL
VINEKGFLFERKIQPDNLFHSEKLSYGNSSNAPFHRLKEASEEWKPEVEKIRTSEDSMSYTFLKKEHIPQASQREIVSLEHEKKPFGVVRVLGQALGAYIISETDQGLAIFDQHAAHERIIYEEILDSFRNNKTSSQQMLFPITLHLKLQETPIMEVCMEDFNKIGFNINPLGGGTFSVGSVPAFMPDIDTERVIKDTLHELMERTITRTWESRKQALAAILACKTHSVKSGNLLDIQEMEHLINRLGTKKNPHTCPHGRPTFYYVTKDEIERKFKRK